MPTSRTFQVVLLGLFAALSIAATAGCGSHDAAAQAPAGMKVGPALTPAQIHAIALKRQGSGAPPP